jgi:hypothetical protein
MVNALRELGKRCQIECELVLVGGAAAIRCGYLQRATNDIDVIEASPALSTLVDLLRQVADELGLSETWMNDGARAFRDVLPADFRERLIEVGRFGTLHTFAVSRVDFILLKLFAFRAVDFEDLRELRPTREELAFVRGELPRLARFNARQAHLIELYLEQGSE